MLSLALLTAATLCASACDVHPIDLLPPVPDDASGGGPSAVDPTGGTGSGGDATGGTAGAPSGGAFSGGSGGDSTGGATGGMGGEPIDPPPPSLRVLMVVDDLPISTDDAIEMRLLALSGMLDSSIGVDRLAEDMTTPADTEGYDLVVVSSSADSGGIGGSLKDIAVPVLVLEPGIFNLMGLGGTRASSPDTEMEIVEETHPIAHGQSGVIKICGGNQSIVGQQLLMGGALVSRGVVNSNAGIIVAYEQGVDVGGPLPERRVSYGALKLAPCQTESAWAFFDAAVRWLVRR